MSAEQAAGAMDVEVVNTPRTALDFNLPKGKQFFLNSRGQRLHLRTFLPENGQAETVLFWYHGYAAHVNGPTLKKFADGMTKEGFGVMCVDAHGHGYSDGERVYISRYQHLIEDAMDIVDIIARGEEDSEKCHLGLDAQVRETLRTVPIVFGGQSLGGCMAFLLGLQLCDDETRKDIAARFLGVMTNCPAIVGNPPPRPVVMVLKYVMAPLFPKMQLPSFLEKVSVPELVWTSKESMAMGMLDKIDQPGGLGWPGTMRLGTGSQLLDMVGNLQARLQDVRFPFLVLHDPADGIVKFEGTQKLLQEASTPTGIPRGREVKEMPSLKHDLLSNATEEMLEAYVDWAKARRAVFEDHAST